MTTEELYRRLLAWEGERVAFLVGGAEGHPEAVREEADLLLSLSPHPAARARPPRPHGAALPRPDLEGGAPLPPAMTYEAFVELVERLWEEVPEDFKRGLQGVHVFPEAKPEPGLEGVWRLGEYLDPGPPSAFGGFEDLGRHIALYYGSFLEVAGEGFDWEAEVWETLLHELRHHLESLAGRDDLVQEDLRRLDAFRRGGPSGEG